MADLTYDEVVDRLAETIGRYLASEVSGNNQPCMSGDPRDRLHPHRRRHFDSACREAAEASIQALSAAGIALVPREATEGMRVIGLTTMSEVLAWMWQKREGHPEPICRFTPPLFGRDSDAIFAAMLAAGEIREP